MDRKSIRDKSVGVWDCSYIGATFTEWNILKINSNGDFEGCNSWINQYGSEY